MIRRPAGWKYERLPDRVLLAATQPDLIATFRYFERLQPLKVVGDLVAHHEAALRLSSRTDLVMEPIVTNEGEYGAMVHFRATQQHRQITCAMAFVFGDDWYACLQGLSDPRYTSELQSVVRDVALTEELRLGTRQRRYVFEPPAWRGITIGQSIAHYFPDDYPLIDAKITVFPAVPLVANQQPIIDLQRRLGEHIIATVPGLSSGFVVQHREIAVPFSATSGLSGTRWLIAGVWDGGMPVVRDLVLLRDDVYAYAVELSSAPDDRASAVDVFEKLARSVQPLPRRVSIEASTQAVSHWAD